MLFNYLSRQKNNRKNIKSIAILIFFAFLVTIFTGLFSAQISHAAINKEINYQGKLTDAGGVSVANGAYNMKLTIYDAASAGTALWTSRGTVGVPTAKSITVTNGIFSTMLGEAGDNAMTLDFGANSYYLGVTVGADAEMTPRKKIGAVPQAINSNNLIGDGMINLAGSATTTTANTIAANSLTSGTALQLSSSSASLNSTNGILYVANTTAGTSGVVARIQSNSTAGSGMTVLANGKVGIGTTNPGVTLDVVGQGRFIGSAATTPALKLGTGTGGIMSSGTNDIALVSNSINVATFVATSATDVRFQINTTNYSTMFGQYEGNWFGVINPMIMQPLSPTTAHDIAITGTQNNPANGIVIKAAGGVGVGYADPGTAKLAISGNVGIGTTGPTHKFEVVGDATDTARIAYFRSNKTNMPNTSIEIDSPTGYNSNVVFKENNTDKFMFGYNANYATGGRVPDTFELYSFVSSAPIMAVHQSAPANSFYINNLGNVGIGTTAPGYVLDVNGNINIANGSTYKVNGNDYAIDYLADAQKDTTNNNLFLGHNGFSGTFYNNYNTAIGIGALDNSNIDNTQGIFGDNNTAIGYQTLSSNTIGYNNSAMGVSALFSNTTGYDNSAMGVNALYGNTSGSYNSAMGVSALFSNTTGYNNSAMGMYALYSNTTGHDNSAMGMYALQNNTTGYDNSAVGSYALQNNTTGYDNSAMGMFALFSNTDGTDNSAMGMKALHSNTTGTDNSAMGVNALYGNTTGFNNSAMGMNALLNITTGYYNSAMGMNAGRFISGGSVANQTSNNSLYLGYNSMALADGDTNEIVIGASAIGNGNNSVTLGNTSIAKTILQGNVGIGTTSPGENLDVNGNINFSTTLANSGIIKQNQTPFIHSFGTSNFFAGVNAGNFTFTGIKHVGIGENALSALTTGSADVAVGYNALAANTTGTNNTAVGFSTLAANTIGYANSAFGRDALLTNLSGINNSAFGYQSLKVNSSGNSNSAFGYLALSSNVVGSYNSAVGLGALASATAGYNTAVGYRSGSSIATGSYNTFLGEEAGYNVLQKVDAVNSMALGYGTYNTADNQIVMGNTSITQTLLNGNVGIGTTNPGGNLHIFSANNSNLVLDAVAANQSAIQFKKDGAANAKWIEYVPGSSNDLRFYDGSADQLTLQNGGNVGIGDTTPASLFTVGSGDLFQINTSGQVVAGTWHGTTMEAQYGGTGIDTHLSTGIPTISSGTWSVANSLGVALGGTGTTTQFTQGSLVFAGASGVYSQDNSNLFWDNTNKYLRIGASPYSIGVDATDSDKFKIYPGSGVAGTGSFSIDRDGVTSISSLNMGTQNFQQDLGIINWIDMSVTSAATNGTVESYSAQLDGNPLLTLYGTSDGAGGVANLGVGIGTTTPAYALDVKASGTGVIARFSSNNSTGCTLATGGTISCSSDVNLKKNISDIGYGLDTLMGLRPVEFNWKSDSDSTTRTLGFIAQEVEGVLPQLVMTDANGLKELNTIGLVPVLAKSIQQQQLQILASDKQLADITLKTDENISTIDQLKQSIDTQLALIDSKFKAAADSTEALSASNDARMGSIESMLSGIQGQIDEIKSQSELGLLVAKTDLNTQDIQLIKMVLGIGVTENSSDVQIAGKLTAKIVEGGKLVISVKDKDARTIGSEEILAVNKDINNDGIDDETKSDGKSYFVKTTAVTLSSRIFITPKVPLNQGIAVSDIKIGEGFTISVKNPVSENVPCDWVIMDEN